MVLYLALSTWDNEVSDTMHRLKADARLEATPAFRALVVQVRLAPDPSARGGALEYTAATAAVSCS